MNKEFYLLCNAHLDPVWLWKKEEGMAEAISTFRVAANFCEKYDGFIFNHNESVLYEWVEEYEPELFKRIQNLVKEGKWHIMGGWYLQPDCIMPSGESFIRQIETGNAYFKEKFGVTPKTAINFDPFGHSRGLVQILAKTGYESYLFMRPFRIIPEQNFIWKGYDGSEILGHCLLGIYNSPKGRISQNLDQLIAVGQDKTLMCWGVGNHGGGPSEEDWKTILEYKEKHPEIDFITTSCDGYFSTVNKENLRVFDGSLMHCMVGCYTSMAQIKQKHRKLENELSLCEKMLAVSGVNYDKNEMKRAEKALLFSEFHDSLPGTMIKPAEEQMLRQMDYGREILANNCAKAFFKLCEGQLEGKRGEIPVLVFNPHPYKIEQEVEVEYQIEDQNFNPTEYTVARVRTQNGEYLPTQNIKEDSSVNFDWRKRIVFRATLEPMSLNRFDCELEVKNTTGRPISPCDENDTHFLFENDRLKVTISKETGLIDKYCVDGKDYLKENSGQITVFDDNEDPWGMNLVGFNNQIDAFKLVSKEEANAFNGYPDENIDNVRVIENGEVVTKIQAIFKYSKSYAVVTYTMSKFDEYVDVKVKIYSNDANKFYKLELPTTLENSEYAGQMAFGREIFPKSGSEVSYQKWCGLFEDEKGFAVLNNGTYGGSCVEDTMYISVLRTPVYSAHPLGDRPTTEHTRSHDHIDMGEREFTYRLTTEVACLDAKAEEYGQAPYVLSFFPSGLDEKKETRVELNNPALILSRYEKNDDGTYNARIYNSSSVEQSGKFYYDNKEIDITLSPYSFETYKGI
ncbi:MAG: alpha-mannosidase [Clostridia bacterium]|nr:alpha-mannosidase [Clostridia bacterium]